jgi:pimeloyl-ACP methyl ester carboxylesterase
MRFRIFPAALAAAAPAAAEVGNVTPTGFLVTHKAPLKSAPRHVFAAIQQVGKWWNEEHTYSGNAGHMSIDLRAGGCFCERWDGNSVEHARVLWVARDKTLRLEGALGPLQELGVNGIIQFDLKPRGDDTDLTLTYRVRGVAEAGLDKTAAAVDKVLAEQVARLVRFVETGAPVPVAAPAPLQDQYFDSAGVRIRYLEAGAGRDPVILLHDRGSNIEQQWLETRIMPSLVNQEIFRVIAIDLRGHGKSDKPATEGLGAEAARDVVRLMEHLKIARAHVVGYGVGATMAIYLSTTNPERFITMTIAGGAHARAGSAPVELAELAVTDAQMKAVPVPSLGLIGTRDPALGELLRLKAVMPRLVRMVSLRDETHGSAPRNPEFVLAIQYFLRYHPARLVN